MAIGSLAVRVSSDTTQFGRGMSKASRQAQRFGRDVGQQTARIAKFSAAVASAAAASTALIVQSAGQAARELKTLANVSNASLVEFQKQAAAARTVGIENEKLADIFKDVQDRVGDFISTGAGPMADFFENIAPKVGVTAQQFQKLSGPEALQLYVKSLQDANVSQEEMTFYMEAMASDSARLLPLLRNNAAQMRQFGDRAEDAGMILSALEVEKLTQMEQSMSEAYSTSKTLSQQFAAELAPIVEGVANRFIEAANKSDDFTGAIRTGMDASINVTANMLNAIEQVSVGIGHVWDNYQSLPKWVQEVGMVGAIIGGKPGKWAVGTLAALGEVNRRAKETIDMVMGDMGEEAQRGSSEEVSLFGAIFKDPEEDADSWGARFKAEIETMRQEAEKSARESLEMGDMTSMLGGGQQQAEGEGSGRTKTAEQERERIAAKLEVIKEGHASEMELLQQRYMRENEILAQAKERERNTEKEYQRLMQKQAESHQSKLTEIETKAMSQREKFERATMSQRVSTVAGDLAQMTSDVARENKTMFRINKAAAIAQATMDAVKGAMMTWNTYPYPLNVAMTAAHVAGSVARISQLKSSSFSGGGAAPSADSGRGTPVVTQSGGGGGTSSQGGGGGEAPQRLAVEGISEDQLYSGTAVRGLAQKLKEHAEDGGEVVVL